ncbi:MAG: type II secretion system F family protein [Magnetococcales bacterium]|nr:type II secretion system F family protein [Magnetococcales bacterium]
MPKFQYKGRNAKGEVVESQSTAVNRAVLAEQLIGQGITPLKITESKESAQSAFSFLDVGGWPEEDEIILFTRQLNALVKAGVPILRSLQGLRESMPNKKFAAILGEVGRELESGRDLSSAMSDHRKVFNNIYVRMVAIGENTGMLDEALAQLFKYLEAERDTSKQIKSALRYPTFIVIAMFLAIFILNYFVIPAFAGIFERSGTELPWATQVLLTTSRFTQNYWYLIIGGAVGVVMAIKVYIQSKNGQRVWDRYKIRMPIIGSILRRATLSRFARSFSMGAEAGVPVLDTLRSVSQAVNNVYVGEKILEMRDNIERGESLTNAAHKTELFTPLVMQMLSVGDETGQMDEMMREVAEFYEREVDYDVKALSSAIEPILLLFLGVVIVILALGIFLPMWDMSSAIK